MIKIIGGRGTGKTTKLIEISSERNIPILCCTNKDKRNLMERAAAMNLKIPTPIIFDLDIHNGFEQDVLVDELEFAASCLFQAYGYKIQGYSINTNDLGVELYET